MNQSVYESCKAFMKKYPKTIAWRIRKHSSVVQEHLNDDEVVLYSFAGQKDAGMLQPFFTTVIVFTNKRMLLGRKRYLASELMSPNFQIREFAQRAAINQPLQGTAADLIKMAMIEVDKLLKEKNLKSKMIMQVHDELVFEAPKEEIPVLNKLVPSVMDTAVKLSVPLKVDSKYGDTWYDLKK